MILYLQKCKSWYCDRCRKLKARNAFNACLANRYLFKFPQLLTLTLNPSKFIDGWHAYTYVRQNKYVPRLLALMGLRHWVCVMEFQTNGMPHFHILCDFSHYPSKWVKKVKGELIVSDVPVKGFHYVPHWFDYAKLQSKWSGWGLGEFVNVAKLRIKSPSPLRAINYICKYLFKRPEKGYPDWVMSANNLKVFTHSRSFKVDGLKYQSGEKQEKEYTGRMPNSYRVFNCCRKLACYSGDGFLKILPFSLEKTNDLANCLSLPPLERREIDMGSYVLTYYKMHKTLYEAIDNFLSYEENISLVHEYNFREYISTTNESDNEFILA